jgi:hypothetical protein
LKIEQNIHFDACALIALLTKENGYKNVENIIEESRNKQAQIIMHNVNLLEVYYDIYKLYDETSAINFLNEIKNPRRERRGIKDFSLKSMCLRGNRSPAPPVLRPKGRGIKPQRD